MKPIIEIADLQEFRKLIPIAAPLYGLDAVIAPVSFALDPGKLIDGAGSAGAAMRIAAAEPMVRLNMLSEAVYQTVEVFLALQMYRLFRSAGGNLARQMFVLALVPIPIMFFNLMTEVGALSLALDTGIANAFAPAQRDELAALMIRMHGQGVGIAGIFWGLFLGAVAAPPRPAHHPERIRSEGARPIRVGGGNGMAARVRRDAGDARPGTRRSDRDLREGRGPDAIRRASLHRLVARRGDAHQFPIASSKRRPC